MLELPIRIDLVKELKTLKLKKILLFLSSLLIPGTLVIIMLAILIANILGAGLSTIIIPSMNIFVQGLLLGSRKLKKSIDKEYDELSKYITDKLERNSLVADIEDVKIIPKNIKLGNDLTKKNLVEIFKEGHYVLIHAFPEDIIVRQYQDEDLLHVQILTDKEEKEKALEDISTSDKPKRLMLR